MTIALLYLSYSYNYVRIGVIVLYLHDISDIIVDLLKIFNYCQAFDSLQLHLLPHPMPHRHPHLKLHLHPHCCTTTRSLRASAEPSCWR